MEPSRQLLQSCLVLLPLQGVRQLALGQVRDKTWHVVVTAEEGDSRMDVVWIRLPAGKGMGVYLACVTCRCIPVTFSAFDIHMCQCHCQLSLTELLCH